MNSSKTIKNLLINRKRFFIIYIFKWNEIAKLTRNSTVHRHRLFSGFVLIAFRTFFYLK